MRSTYVVTLRGMRFHARVGILPHERELAQPLELDVSVWLAGDAAAGAAPLDYRVLYDLTVTAVAAQPLGYLEDLVRVVADAARARGGARRVRVTARKPHVALPGPLDHAEVSLDVDAED